MERRGLTIQKKLVKGILPLIRWLPLTSASGFLTGLGRLEYQLHRPLRRTFQAAVADGGATLGCDWDVPRTSRALAGNQIFWVTRDLLLDGVSDRRANEMFRVVGQEHLDAAVAAGKGCLVLTGHFGAHMLPAHWLYRKQYSVRLYMERPRSISRYVSRRFKDDGIHSQNKLFISRKGGSTDAASSILRASRVLKAGMLLFMAGDVRWSGQLTEEARFLGRSMRFSSTWVVMAAMSQAPVLPVTCHIGADRRFQVEFHPAFQVPSDVQRNGEGHLWVQRFVDLLTEQIRLHPESSNDYLFWKPDEPLAA